jgi:hypothetical protein
VGLSYWILKMSKQRNRDEPEIAPPTPDTKQQPIQPEIPPDKDAPKRKRLQKRLDGWLAALRSALY